MRPHAIPERLHREVLQLAGEGKSTRAISAHLVTLGVTASHNAVAKLLKQLRSDRAEVAKAVVREELSTTLAVDVRRLERLVKKLLARIQKSPANLELCKLAEQVRKLIDTKLHYSGADLETEKEVDNDARDLLLGRIAGLVARGKQSQDPGGSQPG